MCVCLHKDCFIMIDVCTCQSKCLFEPFCLDLMIDELLFCVLT